MAKRTEQLEAENAALRAERDAIQQLCVEAGMQEPSTLTMYLRGVFYALQQRTAALARVRAIRPTLPKGDGRWEAVCDEVCARVLAALDAPEAP